MAKEITKAGRYGTPVDAFVFAMLLHYMISARLPPEGKNLIKRWLTAKSLFKKLTYENPGRRLTMEAVLQEPFYSEIHAHVGVFGREIVAVGQVLAGAGE
ncbi:hypothetical protein BGX23_000080 [Mortierella sp. AD031]|nr:hypothetical protein BGX23_000080 [Mortierella sp. AD031]KAG0220048.1 hypothetical protein BGX33_009600 [Mortierella sp. NVP41]